MNEPGPLVLIASPVTWLRRRWREAIQPAFATDEVTEYGQLLDSLPHRRPAVVLLDFHLPGMDGLGSVAALRRARRETKIMLLTSHPDDKEGVLALKAGARGYCEREVAPALLGKAVDAVQRGEIWIGRKLTSHLLDELKALTDKAAVGARPEPAPVDTSRGLGRLTPREGEIVRLLSAGASNKEIASRLTVTERTVKAHLTAIFRKLGVSGRLPVALFALGHSRIARSAEPHAAKAQLTH